MNLSFRLYTSMMAALLFAAPPVVFGVTGSTGGGQAVDNNQPSLPLNFLIAVEGIVPSPSGGPIAGDEAFLGEVRLFAGGFAPLGWRFCDGSLLPISGNEYLFDLLGVTYGGDGSNNFALPDLRGRVPVEAGTHGIGQAFGAESVSLTEAQLPAHSHTRPAGPTGTTGGSQPFSNAQPALPLRYLVGVQGIIDYLGEMRLFAGNFAPPAWRFAEGQLLLRNQNIALFARIGPAYGGDGATTFALPNLNDRVMVSAGQGPGLAAHLAGEQFGAENLTLTNAQLPAHTHTTAAGDTGSTGLGQPFSNSQPSLAMYYIIATSGEFPTEAGGGLGGFLPAVGEVRGMAGPIIPFGWLAADGQLLAIVGNEDLFAIIGNAFGGNGTTHFALPDLRGRVAVGAGQGPGLTVRALGAAYGVENTMLTTAKIPAHSHALDTFAALFPALDPAADANGNGRSNYLDYAAGLNPAASDDASGRPIVFRQGGSLFVQSTIRSSADDVFKGWEYSVNLSGWTPLAPGTEIQETGSVVLSPTRLQVTWQILLPTPPEGRLFLHQRFSTTGN